MNRTSSIRRLAGAATLSAMLSACGGGGTEPPPPPPEQPAAATEITASNMDTVASAALFSAASADNAPGLDSFPLTTGLTSSEPLSAAMRTIVPTLAALATGDVPTAARSTPPTLAMTPPAPPASTLPPIVKESCSGGGNTSVSVVDINSNQVADAGEPLRFEATACKEGDTTLQGKMDVTVLSLTQANGSVTSAKLQIAYGLSAAIGDRIDYMGGSLTVDVASEQGVTTTTMRGTPIRSQGVGDRWLALTHDSYTATVTDLLSGASRLDFSGKFYFTGVGVTRPVAGSILTRTTSPLVVDSNGNIASGVVRVAIDGKPAIMDVTLSNGIASIALDTDGNGSIDTTHNVRIEALRSLF